MKLDSDFSGALDLEKAHGLISVVTHLGVSGVVADDDVVLIGEIDDAFKKILIRHGGGWIVRIVDPEEFGLFGDRRLEWNPGPGESDFLSSSGKK